jgi:hypothetical protein
MISSGSFIRSNLLDPSQPLSGDGGPAVRSELTQIKRSGQGWLRRPLAIDRDQHSFMRNTPLSCTARLSDERKQSGIGRETHKMMLDHYQQTNNLLVSYSPKKLGFF